MKYVLLSFYRHIWGDFLGVNFFLGGVWVEVWKAWDMLGLHNFQQS